MVIVMVMEYNCCNDDDDDDFKNCDEWAKARRQTSCPVMMFNTNESAGVTPSRVSLVLASVTPQSPVPSSDDK